MPALVRKKHYAAWPARQRESNHFMNNDWPKVRGISSQKFAANWPGLIRIPTPQVWKSSPTIQLCIRLLTCVQPALVAGAATPSLHRDEPQPPHAVDYLVVSQSTGAATEKLQELLILKTLTGFFGTDRTANSERFHFHRRCSQNRTASIFYFPFFIFHFFRKNAVI